MADGWRTTTEFRSEGNTAGTSDTYFLSPSGRRFRSRPEIASHLQLAVGPARSGGGYHKSRKRVRGGDPVNGAHEGAAAVEAEMEDEEAEEAEDEEEGVDLNGAAKAAVRQAEAEGLTLQKSSNTAGYRGVHKVIQNGRSPFVAQVTDLGSNNLGKVRNLGSFATAEEAALAYARTPDAQAQVTASSPGSLVGRRLRVR